MLNFIGKAYAAPPALNIGNILKPIQPSAAGGDLTQSVYNVLGWIIFFAGILAVAYLIFSGINYITAGGDDAKATKAKTGIVNAVIGIVVVLLALVIVSYVSRLTDVVVVQ